MPVTTDLNFNALQTALKNMSETNAMFGFKQNEANAPAIGIKTETNEDGTKHIIEMEDAALRQVMQTLGNQSKIVESYTKEMDRLEQQKKSMNPIINALTTVAGNLATNDPRLPPVVRALGQSSRDLNPTMQELTTRQLGIGAELAKIENNKVSGYLGAAQVAHQIEATKEAQLERVQTRINAAIERHTGPASRGFLQSPSTVVASVLRAGGTQAQAYDAAAEAASSYMQYKIAKATERQEDVDKAVATQAALAPGKAAAAKEQFTSELSAREAEQKRMADYRAAITERLLGVKKDIKDMGLGKDEGAAYGVVSMTSHIKELRDLAQKRPDLLNPKFGVKIPYTDVHPFKWWVTQMKGDVEAAQFYSTMAQMKIDNAKYENSVRALGPAGLAFSGNVVPEAGDTMSNFTGKLDVMDKTMGKAFDFIKSNHPKAGLEKWDWRVKQPTPAEIARALAGEGAE